MTSPDAMADAGEWILKIISGPHQGAEVIVRPGRMVVGADRDCDLVLHDVLVAPRHCALTLERGSVTVEPLEGAIFCNGKRIAAAAPVPPFGFVTAGTTHLVLGPAGARWPLLSLADVPELEKESAPISAPADTTTAPSTEDSAPPGGKSLKPPTPEQRRRALWTAGIGGALLIVWLVLWFTWVPRATFSPSPSVRERAEQVLRAFPEAKSVELEPHGDRLVLAGYVESDSAHREITAALRNEVPEVTLRIWSTPRMLETARAFLTERNLNLDLSPGENGELRVRGVVRSADEWARTRQLLLSEVPGLQHLRDEVTFAPPSQPAKPRLAMAAAPAAPPSASLENVSVVALQELGGGQGWLRLSDGGVLFRGARLANGARLAAFHEGRAIVEHGETRFALMVGVNLATALREPLSAEAVPATSLPSPAPAVAKKSDPQNG